MALSRIPKRLKSEYNELIEKLNDANLERLEEYFEALHQLAIGVHVEETTPQGRIRRYQKEPSYEAAKYLIDRGLGKAPDRVEVGRAGDFSLEEYVLRSAQELAALDSATKALPSPARKPPEPLEPPIDGEFDIIGLSEGQQNEEEEAEEAMQSVLGGSSLAQAMKKYGFGGN